MPLPNPKAGEKENDFMGRCMGSDTMKKEFPDQKQRLAVCYSQFRKKKEDVEPENKLDGEGNIIMAENVPLILSATLEVGQNGK